MFSSKYLCLYPTTLKISALMHYCTNKPCDHRHLISSTTTPQNELMTAAINLPANQKVKSVPASWWRETLIGSCGRTGALHLFKTITARKHSTVGSIQTKGPSCSVTDMDTGLSWRIMQATFYSVSHSNMCFIAMTHHLARSFYKAIGSDH